MSPCAGAVDWFYEETPQFLTHRPERAIYWDLFFLEDPSGGQ